MGLIGRLIMVVGLASLPWAATARASETQAPAQAAPGLHGVLLDITRAGDRLVAVGERGIVLLSDDNGVAWRQVTVPVGNTLTAVRFIDARRGWAVGHAGVVLHSEDGGEHWALQLSGGEAAQRELDAARAAGDEARVESAKRLVADGADKPWLAVDFRDARHGLVVGAYGLAMATADGGASWQSWMGRLPNPQGLHLYAVARQGTELYLAGEQGLLLRSSDEGGHFEALQAPYDGSFFALQPLSDGRLLLAGLRGSLLAYDPHAARFQSLENPLPISINAALTAAGSTLVINQAGNLLRVNGNGAATPVPVAPGAPLTAATLAGDGALVAVGFAGPRRLALPANPTPSAE